MGIPNDWRNRQLRQARPSSSIAPSISLQTSIIFAAQIAAMDLVITIDNSTAHLAGALGIPVWVLLPFAPDWRWLLDREDCPWYPAMRLFRQPEPGDWQSVVERVRNSL